MKRFILAAASVFCAITVNAQSFSDALDFGRTFYTGTAKTMGMGNAVASLGGDLGSIGINPAGSAVTGYSQFVITPGLSISSVSGAYAPDQTGTYGATYRQNYTRFNVPNVGVSLKFDTYRQSGLRSITFAFTANSTNDLTSKLVSGGINSKTSKFAEFAMAAKGLDKNVLASSDAFDKFPDFWDVATAYHSGLISSYGGGNNYVGASEYLADDLSYHYVPGELNQSSTVLKYGRKTDLIINWGLNFSDRLFVGFNIGIPVMTYRYLETYNETPLDETLYPVVFEDKSGKQTKTYYRSGLYQYGYNANADGIYGKVGVIFLPTDRLRLAAAIQSPTAFTVAETWRHSGSATYADESFNSPTVKSPEGAYRYNFKSPYVVDAGASYVFGPIGLVSVDYELTDFSVTRFSVMGGDPLDDGYMKTNRINSLFGGLSHEVRVGAEINLPGGFAARAGFNIRTNPEKYYDDSYGRVVTPSLYLSEYNVYESGHVSLSSAHYYGESDKSYSIGLGYKSEGSFFMDVALKMTTFSEYLFYPFYSYTGFTQSGAAVIFPSPAIKVNRNLWNAALTFGWRF